jgi:DNA-binding XRE family transcriptional regulator
MTQYASQHAFDPSSFGSPPGLGENIRKARLRRAHTLETIAERAGITRKTLYRVERGDPAVALGCEGIAGPPA